MTFYPGGSSGTGGGLSAWQFTPESQGAKGDGIVCGDVQSNSSTTYQSPTVVTNAKVGMYIMIHGANGTSSGPVIGTITSISGSNFTVSGSAAGATVASCPAVFGTDDTAAINAAVTAAGNFALGTSGSGAGFGNYYAEVIFSSKIYILGTGPTQTGNGSTTVTFNSQIPLPYPAAVSNGRKLVIALTGAADVGYCQYWGSLVPNLAGTCLVTMLYPTSGQANSGTFGQQSVVGGPTSGAGFTGYAGNQAFANVKAVIKNISIWQPIYCNVYSWDLGFITACNVRQAAAHIFAPTGVNVSSVQPYLNQITVSAFKNSIGTGWKTPVNQNNDDMVLDDVTAEGYECGFRLFDHLSAGRLAAIYSDVACFINPGGGVSHMINVTNFSAEAYNGGILANGASPQLCQVDINWQSECGTVTYDINDPSNYLTGVVRFQDPADLGRGFTMTGGANLVVVNDSLNPGHMASPPGVPLTTVASTPVFRQASVVVHTGVGVTVSAISVNGVSTGLTMAASSSLSIPTVPSGGTVTLAYTGGTPTWDWWLS